MTRRLLVVAALTAAVLSAAALRPADASARNCYEFAASDGEAWFWDFNSFGDGSVNDGSADAFDIYGLLSADGGTDYFPDDDVDGCSFESPREFVFGTDEDFVPGVRASRKVYVSASGRGFARWLDLVENTTAGPITVDIAFEGGVGSDEETVITSSADGNQTADPGEPWIATDDAGDSGPEADDPALAHVADGSGAGRREPLDAWEVDADGFVVARYDDVTIPAGGRVVFMHLAAQRQDRAASAAAASALAAGPAEVFAEMSVDEAELVVNWVATDFDADGVANRPDNCLRQANGDQSNADGDGEGDACDGDDDNDGLGDTVEQAIGSDARRVDSDADGVADNADQCPRVAGEQPDGCRAEDRPPTVAFTQPAQDGAISTFAATRLEATAADDRGVARVLFVDDGQVVCADAEAPYTCDYLPSADDVGSNALAAIAIDTSDQLATASRAARVPRFDARRLTARTSPRADRRAPFRFVTRGRLVRPARVARARGCAGTVAVQIKAGGNTVSTRQVPVRGDCTYRSAVTFSIPGRIVEPRLAVVARFGGNEVLTARRASRHFVRVAAG